VCGAALRIRFVFSEDQLRFAAQVSRKPLGATIRIFNGV